KEAPGVWITPAALLDATILRLQTIPPETLTAVSVLSWANSNAGRMGVDRTTEAPYNGSNGKDQQGQRGRQRDCRAQQVRERGVDQAHQMAARWKTHCPQEVVGAQHRRRSAVHGGRPAGEPAVVDHQVAAPSAAIGARAHSVVFAIAEPG